MKILCVIPSRLASTRTPRKALALIQGKPMIQRVYEQAAKCKTLTKLIVATDSDEIAAVVKNAGGEIMITDPNIKNGSERAAVVAKHHPEMDVIINLQGDEPFVKPEMLTALVQPYLDGETPEMTTLACPLDLETEYPTPAFVKVIVDKNNYALYFSRSPIPYFRQQDYQGELPVYHHQGVYAYRKDFLQVYKNLAPTPLEQIESLEQLRVLENGYQIKVCVTPHRTLEINTPEELKLAQNFLG
jgi:3-deoxy-manno-octulosonate cytidylyltransferase (CMP-KDO synthetase)